MCMLPIFLCKKSHPEQACSRWSLLSTIIFFCFLTWSCFCYIALFVNLNKRLTVRAELIAAWANIDKSVTIWALYTWHRKHHLSNLFQLLIKFWLKIAASIKSYSFDFSYRTVFFCLIIIFPKVESFVLYMSILSVIPVLAECAYSS